MDNNSNSRIESLLNFWSKDRHNLSLCRDILSYYATNFLTADAQSFFEQLSLDLRSNSSLIWLLGQCHLSAGDFSKATNIFSSLGEDKHYSKAYGLSLCAFFQTDYGKVLKILAPALRDKTNPPKAEVIVLAIKAEYHSGLLEPAYARGQALLQSLPSPSAELYGVMAMLALDLNKIQAASQFADLSLASDPNQHDGLLAKASVLLFEQQAKSALGFAQAGVTKFAKSGRI
ncbi:MAG: hypothetical protein AAF988_04775, partial [Pseudomonadota bacterium]